MKLLTTIILTCIICSTLTAQTDSSYILLSSGGRIAGKVDMHQTFLRTPYLTLNDSIKYTLENVQAFQNSEGYFGKVAGTKTSMVLRMSQGKLDLYRATQSSWTAGHSYSFSTPGGMQTVSTPGSFNTSTAEYFSKNGGDILDADYGNLKVALADNPASMRHLNTYRTLNYVQWGLAGGGVALIAGGLTLKQVAAMIGYTWIAVARWEKNKCLPKPSVLLHLRNIYGVGEDWLPVPSAPQLKKSA
ncbi:MAG: helix-turn-helix transcriptional regulator [Ignavibacteriae bacterium]|nr:helix-turn-helix transcriptional regulator [Ignavibacteriota bacterium]